MATWRNDSFNITVSGPTEQASCLKLMVVCDIELHETIVYGGIMDRAGVELAMGTDARGGWCRNWGIDQAKLLARELEFFIDPF